MIRRAARLWVGGRPDWRRSLPLLASTCAIALVDSNPALRVWMVIVLWFLAPEFESR